MPLRRGVLLASLVAVAGCWELGEPTVEPAPVTWVAYPDTVVAGKVFSFEYAGPVAENTCARFDTATVVVRGDTVHVEARRARFETLCSDDRVSFYENTPIVLPSPGRYVVTGTGGARLGVLTVVDSVGGEFSLMGARGEGTVRQAGGCLFFGPGWANNQRPFALEEGAADGARDRLRRVADTDTVVRVEGRLYGFSMCGGFGSRPRILVDSLRVTDGTGADYFSPAPGEAPAPGG